MPRRLSNVVRFEIPACADVDEFCMRIRSRWPGMTEREGDVWHVSARLRNVENDVALLLREVELYVADTGLQAIRYQLDGRFYIMEAPPALGRAQRLTPGVGRPVTPA